ncbi:hypothetical protein WJX77_006762 [Trebouxia sp. C0004]
MTNLCPKCTGLPFVVYVSTKGKVAHGPRIKASSKYGKKASKGDWFTITIEDQPQVIGETTGLKRCDVQMAKKWVRVNKGKLLQIWEDEARSARKKWVKEQAATHLARSTASHTPTILLGWREIAAVRRHQRLAVKDMLQRRQQHDTAQAFASWQLYLAARNEVRSIGARLAQQTRLNTLKHHLAAWWQECQQQQASRLQQMAARVLKRWKVRPLLTVCI